MLYEFDSIEDFARAVTPTKQVHGKDADSQSGGLQRSETIRRAIAGDNSYTSKIETLIGKFSVELPETSNYEVIPAVCGGRVCFADWQNGSPRPMRRMVRTKNDVSPLKVYASMTVSWGVTPAELESRGAAILALLSQLQQVRPIDLYLFNEFHGSGDGWHYQVIRVESRPLSLSVAGFAMCHAGFLRQLCFDFAVDRQSFNGTWPKGFKDAGYEAIRNQRLGISPNDCLIIPSMRHGDLLSSDPQKWLETQLAKYSSQEEG